METIKSFSGSTIPISITFPKSASEYESIYIWIYTSELKPFKFYFGKKDGYYEAVQGETEDKIRCVLTSEMTKNMVGKIYIDAYLKDSLSGEEDNTTFKSFINVELQNCISKNSK